MHVRTILVTRPDVGFFEIHAENYMGEGGPPHRHLQAVAEHYLLSIHGVGLSLGGTRNLDSGHLGRLAALVRRYEPMLVSEHLAWSSSGSGYLNDLLPLPYTRAALDRVATHIDQVQTVLGRRILLENPSTYLAFEESVLAETCFIAELARRTGCGLLLDVNNVYVSSVNRGGDPEAYLAAFPMQWVEEIHLAGHVSRVNPQGAALLIDSHDRPVCEAVWDLYQAAIARCGPVPTLIERDADIPAWDELYAEVRRARDCMAALAEPGSLRSAAERQEQFGMAILDPALPVPPGLHGPVGSEQAQRFAVYRANVAVGLTEALRSSFPVVDKLVGTEFFTAMARAYALKAPPSSPVLLTYGGGFSGFIAWFEPAAVLPYLAEIARLEWLWLEAYHAAEAEALAIGHLQQVPVDRLIDLRLTLHPSARFSRFARPALSIWRAHQDGKEPGTMEIGDAPEHVLIVRPQADVLMLDVTEGALVILEVTSAGGTIGEAVTAALKVEPGLQLADFLGTLFGAGAVIGFCAAERPAVPAGERLKA